MEIEINMNVDSFVNSKKLLEDKPLGECLYEVNKLLMSTKDTKEIAYYRSVMYYCENPIKIRLMEFAIKRDGWNKKS